MFLLLDGAVRIVCDAPDGVRIEVAKLEAGDLLGEMAILDPAPRAASAIALDPTTVLLIAGAVLAAGLVGFWFLRRNSHNSNKR